MKLLHTSDWHVGRSIRGNTRAEEHRQVLEEIAIIAEGEHVDLVIVAGDLFDTSTPTPESEEIVYRALLALTRGGAPVAVISGNHDHPRRLRAVAPLLELGSIQLVTEPTRPDDGGVLQITAGDGADLRLAMLPFVSKRGIVRSADLMEAEAFENAQRYSDRMRLLIEALCGSFSTDTVNVLAAHAFVLGAAAGGGERPAHLVEEYAVTAPSFPPTIGYGALGHLHRAQRIPAGPPLHYCGSPLQLDFGEVEQVKQVNIVELAPGVPADVRAVPLAAGRPLRSVHGTIDELADVTIDGDPWLRVTVRGPRRAGLADDVRQLLGPGVVEVRMEAPPGSGAARRRDHATRSPQQLFDEYLAHEGHDDDRVRALFGELLAAEIGASAGS